MTKIMRGGSREPLCPFCRRLFERPHDIKAELGNIFTGGKCECGAAYVFDRTGHNLGEAYVDALVFACHGDWETAWKLTPEIDYEIKSLYYDFEGHQLIEGVSKVSRGRTNENLLFIALKTEGQRIEGTN